MSTPNPALVRVAVDERPDLLPSSVMLIATRQTTAEIDLPDLVAIASDAVPTQVANPRRTSWRTLLQLAIAIFSALPQIIPIVLGQWDPVWLSTVLGQVLAVQLVVTRIMAIAGVNAWLTENAPAIAAIPSAQIPSR